MKIINLLPPEKKNDIKLELLNSFILRNCLVILLGIVLLVVFLAANLFIINIYNNINQMEINQVRSGESSKLIQKAKSEIDNNYNKISYSIKAIRSETPFWDYLNEINELLPEDVYYSKITLDSSFIKLGGLAKDREGLVEFKKSLESSILFSKIEMPISNFTSQENVSFEINLYFPEK